MSEGKMEGVCYTIGYADLPSGIFLDRIKENAIETIIDVRSSPYSAYQNQYNREVIKRFLNNNQIEYIFCGDKIGGRYTDPRLLYADGVVNYENVRKRMEFQHGIDVLIDLIREGRKICLMCSEKLPEKCHRFILVSRELQNRGVRVLHIVPDVGLISNEELEVKLIKEMFAGQKPLFGNQSDTRERLYRELNQSYGYHVSLESNETGRKDESKKGTQETLF
jgi:uncharacterized protein (DUF488 family)